MWSPTRRRRKMLFLSRSCRLDSGRCDFKRKERKREREEREKGRVCEVCERDRTMPSADSHRSDRRHCTRGIPFLRRGTAGRNVVVTKRGEVHEVARMREYRTQVSPGHRVAHRRKSRVARRVASRDHQSGTGHWRRASRGSTDIKITGHAAQKATRSCIVVQVQCGCIPRHIRPATYGRVVGGGARRGESPVRYWDISLRASRGWTRSSAIYAPEAAAYLFSSASRGRSVSPRTPVHGTINDRECTCIITVRKDCP